MTTQQKPHSSREAYNKGGFFLLLGSLGLSFVWFVYVSGLTSQVQLDELDSLALLAESGEAGQAALQKFWLSSEVLIDRGKTVYQTYCASCHGPKGLGDGPAGGGLSPPPRNLVEGDFKQGGSSIALYNTLMKGIEGTSMVSFSYLSQLDRWTLVHYVRSISRNKVKDDEEELKEFAQSRP